MLGKIQHWPIGIPVRFQHTFISRSFLDDFRIFVGDLGPEVNDTMLHQAFAPYGSITKCRVVRDRRSQKSKGYGFVGFREPQDFLKGIREMNGTLTSLVYSLIMYREIYRQSSREAQKEYLD